jgi:predicted peroxiredoxin
MAEPGLQIIITSGPEDAARATLGFAAAAAASATGTEVLLFLAMQGAQWGLQSEGNQPGWPGFQPIAELLELIQACGGKIEVCSNCLRGLCTVAGPGVPGPVLRPGLVYGGLTTVAERMSHMPTVTF